MKDEQFYELSLVIPLAQEEYEQLTKIADVREMDINVVLRQAIIDEIAKGLTEVAEAETRDTIELVVGQDGTVAEMNFFGAPGKERD